jgi:hypothetical protein
MSKPYRPSNGSEGVYFMASFCDKCENDIDEENPCPIIGASMAYGVDDPRYPKEWIQDEVGLGEFPIKNPKCTNFKPDAGTKEEK